MQVFEPKGICPKEIQFSVEDGKVRNVKFTRGCKGNLQAISILLEGMDAQEAIQKLKGIECGSKQTSCSDQLAIALEQATK